MNKLFISLFALLMPLCANAQLDELFDTKPVKKEKVKFEQRTYDKIPTEDGKIILRYTTDIPGKSKNEIYGMLAYWAEKRFAGESVRGEWPDERFFKNLIYSSIKQANRQEGTIKCQGAEEIIVTNKLLVKNWAEFYYTLELTVKDGHLDAVISNIYYSLEPEAERIRLKAEEFISDESIKESRGRFVKNAIKYRQETIKRLKSLLKEVDMVAKTKSMSN